MMDSMALAYQMKKKALKMSRGGMDCPDCTSGKCMAHGGDVYAKDGDDVVSHIMKKRYSEGGRVANDDDDITDFMPNEFDDLSLRDDLEEHETGANSGDEIGDPKEDEEDRDVVSMIMKSRRLKDKMPSYGR